MNIAEYCGHGMEKNKIDSTAFKQKNSGKKRATKRKTGIKISENLAKGNEKLLHMAHQTTEVVVLTSWFFKLRHYGRRQQIFLFYPLPTDAEFDATAMWNQNIFIIRRERKRKKCWYSVWWYRKRTAYHAINKAKMTKSQRSNNNDIDNGDTQTRMAPNRRQTKIKTAREKK